MCHIMEDLRRETAEKTKIEMARKIILSGEMSEDKVKKMFGLSDDDLKTDEDKASWGMHMCRIMGDLRK